MLLLLLLLWPVVIFAMRSLRLVASLKLLKLSAVTLESRRNAGLLNNLDKKKEKKLLKLKTVV